MRFPLCAPDVNDEMIRDIGPLVFGRDVVAVRYIDGKREEIRASVRAGGRERGLRGRSNRQLCQES